MPPVKRLTLSGFFALAIAVVALVVAVAMALLLAHSRRTVLEESDKLQLAAAQRIEDAVTAELGRASGALEDLARGITNSVLPIDDPAALEAPLLVRLLADSHLEELTFTRATARRYTADGAPDLFPGRRFQISVSRTPEGGFITRVVTAQPMAAALPAAPAAVPAAPAAPPPTPPSAPPEPPEPPEPRASFSVAVRRHNLNGLFPHAPLIPAGQAPDPTTDLTFSVVASEGLRAKTVWSDLHYAEADRADHAMPPEQRRVALTVQRAIFAPRPPPRPSPPLAPEEGELLGVVRSGLLTRDLDAIAQLRPDPSSADPQRVAVIARGSEGRLQLVTRPSPADRLVSIDGELRVDMSAAAALPPAELAALLASPLAARFAAGEPRVTGAIEVGDTRWRVSLTELPPTIGGIDGWAVAVLVVEEHYTRGVMAAQRGVLIAFAAALAALLLVGGIALAMVRRDLAKIVAATARMRAFDFAPVADRSAFRDVDDAMAGLERAKTVVRALGKYVPMDLVRRLYADNKEPALGGELLDVSILFTDIEGFTSLAERLPVGELALHLGAYLEAMTDAIERTGGTIDKYIGDAVMAVWNAPSRVPDHASAACSATLACLRATEALYASPAWAGLPPLVTRFGLHRDRVLVGHFGAPTRLSYTALGDGVNLAARLEPLCKQYGVHVLVSEDIVAQAKAAYRFRLLDRVAVKGKQRGIEIYELLGPLSAGDTAGAQGATSPHTDPPGSHQALPDDALAHAHRAYAEAFSAYQARDFATAAALLQSHTSIDPPSAVLAARCRALAAAPPPSDWDGVHVAQSK